MKLNKNNIIKQLQLETLPEEGGYFRRAFTHPTGVEADALPEAFPKYRKLMTGIYYLVTEDSFSALHLLQASETFHYHAGDSLEMLQLKEGGPCRWLRIGMDLAAGDEPFVIVPGNTWQGTRLVPGGKNGWALLSVMVSPGFDWDDFQLGDRATLTAQFPDWAKDIQQLTR